jgi:hypothetical protein
MILRRLGRMDEAGRDTREGLEIRVELLGSKHADVAHSWLNVGRVEIELGRRDAAVDALSRALEIRLASLGPDHPDTKNVQADLALACAMPRR